MGKTSCCRNDICVYTSLGEKFGEMEHLEGRTGGSAGPMGSAQQVAAGTPLVNHSARLDLSVALSANLVLLTVYKLVPTSVCLCAGRGNIGANPQVSTLTWYEPHFSRCLGFRRLCAQPG